MSPTIKVETISVVHTLNNRSTRAIRRSSNLADPKLPFYVTLAPGDTLTQSGTSVSGTTYLGELAMNDGDSVTTGSDASGPTLLHLGEGHVFTLLPHTTVSVKVKDADSTPAATSMDSNVDYLILTKGGLLGSSGVHGGKAGGEDLLASLEPTQSGGGTVIIKSGGSTTGVKGSTFLIRIVGNSTVVNLFDCLSAHFVNKDGNTYDADGTAKEEVTVPSTGQITHK